MSTYYTFNQDDFKNAVDVDNTDLQEHLSSINSNLEHINITKEINSKNFNVDIFFSKELTEQDIDKLINAIHDYKFKICDNTNTILLHMLPPKTNSGTFQAGIWITRPLNICPNNQKNCILENNQFTLNAGTYYIHITASVFGVKGHQMRLQNITNNYTEAYSNNGYAEYGDDAILFVYLKLELSTIFEVQHICEKSIKDVGFGRPISSNEPEIYCRIVIKNAHHI